MAIIPVAEAARSAERLLEIVREAGGDPIPLEGLEDGVLSLWDVIEALAAPGDPKDPSVERKYLAGAGIHDLGAKVSEVWDRHREHRDFIKPHLKLLAKTSFTGQNVANARWDRKGEAAREHGSADKVIELYWACLCIIAGMQISLDDPVMSSQGRNPDVIATARDGTRWAFAIKTLSEVENSERAAKNMSDNIAKAFEQLLRAECDKGIVVVNLKNVLNHTSIRNSGVFINAIAAQNAIGVEIAKIIKPFYLNDVKDIESLFSSKSKVAPLVILIAHTTALVTPPGHKAMFTELKTMLGMSLPTPEEHLPGTFGREATMLANDFNHLVQIVI